MATITDVARLAGVSVSTVSHVVNGTRPVGAETRKRVDTALEQTGYQTHSVARALRRARTDSIGLIVPARQPVFGEMISGIEHEARAAGFILLLTNSAEDHALELASVAALRERRVDGLIVAPASGSPTELIESLRRAHIPVVVIDRLVTQSVDQVGVENTEPMRALVRHLIERGHTRIGLIAGDQGVATLAERYQGYVDALDEAGITFDESIVLTDKAIPGDGRAAVRELLRRRDRPTALVSASMVMTVGMLQAARDRGLVVPRDLAVATFDEPMYADLFSPRLTSVVQPAFQIGREGVRLLLRRIERPDVPPRTVRLRPRIAHRDSCGCPPGSPATLEVTA
jgi:LacI family transcriptional regulator